jgi:hypothetical protein
LRHVAVHGESTEAPESTPARAAPEPIRAAQVAAADAFTSPPSPLTSTWTTPPADPYVDYLPRSALSVGPRPQLPVLIDYPPFVGDAERYVCEFEIFIDDNGGVVRVVADDPSLPSILAQAVRDAFLLARFTPGEVDGLAVRSRMRIEVVFESRPAAG